METTERGKTMKVFAMNDCDWWMAETLEQAKEDYLKSGHGLTAEEAFKDPHELSDADLNKLRFVTEEGTRHSFREELRIRQAINPESQFFASTEF